MLAAAENGAKSSWGLELCQNLTIYSPICRAASARHPNASKISNIGFTDIQDLSVLQYDAHIVYSFWDCMDAGVRDHIVKLSAEARSVSYFVATNARGETAEAQREHRYSVRSGSVPGRLNWTEQ